MRVSLDTNVWIFGIVGSDHFCEQILVNLAEFDVIVPNQVRLELARNLSQKNLKKFYYFVSEFDVGTHLVGEVMKIVLKLGVNRPVFLL